MVTIERHLFPRFPRRKTHYSLHVQYSTLTFTFYNTIERRSCFILCVFLCSLAKGLGHQDWKASNGFFHRFCLKNGVLSKKICGESLGCPDYSVFMEQTLVPLLQKYEPRDIYNCDETSLFGKALPTRTYAFKGDDVKGDKCSFSKDRHTLMLCCNMNGTDKLRPVLIGKAERPRCLKRKGLGLSDLGVDYYNNKKGWMTGALFELWLKQWNEKLARQKRHVLLLIDNAPSHTHSTYSNIEVQFLPKNTTSKLQPLDQGILRCVKLHYRRLLAEKYLAALENKEDAVEVMRKVDFLAVHDNIVKAWDNITPTLIQNAFHKAGFSTAVPAPPEPEPTVDRNIWDNIQKTFGVTMEFEDYATLDDRVETGEHMTDAEIVEQVKKDQQRLERGANGEIELSDAEADDDDDSDSESVVSSAASESDADIIHNSNKFLAIVAQQRAYLLRNKLPKEASDALSTLEMFIVENKLSLCNRQSTLKSFFQSR